MIVEVLSNILRMAVIIFQSLSFKYRGKFVTYSHRQRKYNADCWKNNKKYSHLMSDF